MKSPEMAMSGRAARTFSMRPEVGFGRVAAVHRLEDAVASPTAPASADRASACRPRHARRSARRSCRRGDWWCSGCAPAHRSSRARGSAASRPPCRPPDQALTFWPSRVISRAPPSTSDCASATMSAERAADLGAARVGDDAIGAEFVAAFLDGEEGARADLAARREGAELGDRRHVGVDRAAARRRPRRPSRAGGDRPAARRRGRSSWSGALASAALGLGDAAGERDHRPLPSSRRRRPTSE